MLPAGYFVHAMSIGGEESGAGVCRFPIVLIGKFSGGVWLPLRGVWKVPNSLAGVRVDGAVTIPHLSFKTGLEPFNSSGSSFM
jgi:hypothetical protein